MIAATLPPLDRPGLRPSLAEHVGYGAVAVGLHLLVGYWVPSLTVWPDFVALPPSISVRLLPMAEVPQAEPAKPLPPVKPPPAAPKPAATSSRATAEQKPPVLAAAPATAPSRFEVAPELPASVSQASAAPPAPTAAAAAPVAVVAARFDADYLHNPKPAYPTLSRRNGEEGTVLLKVRVSAQGTALDVAVSKPSGFARLDGAAVEAVARWRFVPARRGDEAVESSVAVPISFALE